MTCRNILILAFLGGATLLFCLVPGCTVKEDRDSCPWVLVLDLSAVDDEAYSKLYANVYGPSDAGAVLDSPFDDECVLYLERGMNEEMVTSIETDDGEVEIGYGSDCPELWHWYKSREFYGETIRDTVTLHKLYCCLTLKVVSALADEEYPFALVVTGNVCGYLMDGTPTQGDFYVIRNPSSQGWCSLNLPRQTDSSLRLDLMSESESVRSFAIGEYISESGYEWDAEDLEDITMEIDFAKTVIRLSTDRWTKVLNFSVEI